MPIRLALLALLFLAGSALADEVILANGDRLTGTVVRKEGEELIFKTSYAGEIKIAWSEVVRVTTEDPMALILSDQSLAQAKVIGEVRKRKPAPAEPGADVQADTGAGPKLEPAPPTPAPSPQPDAAQPEPPAIPIDTVAYINAGSGIDLLGVRWKVGSPGTELEFAL